MLGSGNGEYSAVVRNVPPLEPFQPCTSGPRFEQVSERQLAWARGETLQPTAYNPFFLHMLHVVGVGSTVHALSDGSVWCGMLRTTALNVTPVEPCRSGGEGVRVVGVHAVARSQEAAPPPRTTVQGYIAHKKLPPLGPNTRPIPRPLWPLEPYQPCTSGEEAQELGWVQGLGFRIYG